MRAKKTKKTKKGTRSGKAGPQCGLCGKTKRLMKTECCDRWICDDEDQYVMFSHARNSCCRNHRRLTLCGFHWTEEHAGSWPDCEKCRSEFETETYVGYGTNEYNFERLKDPPSYEPTTCGTCGEVIVLAGGGYSIRGDTYSCHACSRKRFPNAPFFSPLAGPTQPPPAASASTEGLGLHGAEPTRAGAVATANAPAKIHLYHPVVEQLLHQGIAIDDAVLRDILALGERVVPDLERLLDHAGEAAEAYADEGEAETSFALHALFLLGELRSSRSLPVVLRFLSQDEAALDLWLGDVVFEEAFCPIAGCMGGRLSEVSAFVADWTTVPSARLAVCRALLVEAAKSPVHRQAAAAVMRTHFDDVRARQKSVRLTEDEEFGLSDTMRLCAEAGLTELEKPIVSLIRADDGFSDVLSVEDYLDIPPMPPPSMGLFDAYERIRSWPSWGDIYGEAITEGVPLDLGAVAPPHATHGHATHGHATHGHATHGHATHDHARREPFQRATPKVGRNEPCPCGSGKKYKRCCGGR